MTLGSLLAFLDKKYVISSYKCGLEYLGIFPEKEGNYYLQVEVSWSFG